MTKRVAPAHAIGSALIAVILWSAILLALFTIIFEFTSLTYTQASREIRAAQAINLGNSGLNHAIAQYRTVGNYQGETYGLATGEVDTFVTETNEAVLITSQAYVPDKNSARRVCRAFRVNLNPLDAAIIKKTYQELAGCDTSLVASGPNTPPTLSITQPASGTASYPSGSLVVPEVTLADDDNVVTAALYYDTNNTGFDGEAITGPCAVVPEGSDVGCNWAANVPVGEYYIYGVTSDGFNPLVRAYSPGTITITNREPSLAIFKPNGVNDTVVAGQNYTIQYSANDDDATTVAFFYDSDNQGYDGVALTGACATAPLTNAGNCAFSTSGIPKSTYYIYGLLNDGVHPEIKVYSSGPFTIVDPPPTLSIHEPNGVDDTVFAGDSYNVTYSYTDSGANPRVAFFRDTDASGYNGVAITGACATAPTGTEITCAWDTTGLAPGDYFVYGQTHNDTNQSTQTYAPGKLTVLAALQDPSITVLNPVGNEAPLTVGATLTVQFTFTNPNAGQTAQADFYYSPVNSADGPKIGLGTCQSPQQPGPGTRSCTWNTSGITPGNYYVEAKAVSGPKTKTVYSPGTITINGIPPNQSPQLEIIDPNAGSAPIYKPNGQNTVNFPVRLKASDSDNPSVPVKLYYDTNNQDFDGTALPINCTSTVQGPNVTCTAFMPATLAYGSYYIYGTMDDTHNPIVKAYSAAPFVYGNQPPTLTITSPSNDTQVGLTSSVTIAYTAADPDSAALSGEFYFDTDNTGYDGTPINPGCTSITVSTNATCSFTPQSIGMAPGSYYIYGKINDNHNPDVKTYSLGRVIVQSPPVPSLSILRPGGGNPPVEITIPRGGTASLRAGGGAGLQKATFYYDDTFHNNVGETPGYNGVKISQCANVVRQYGTFDCNWNTVGVPLGSYYIYAKADGDPAYQAVTSAYSARTVTILPQCADQFDNDTNGTTDYAGGDAGCSDAQDDTETFLPTVSIDKINAIAKDSAGNVYSVGSRQYNASDPDMIIRKTKADGSVDTSFGTNGFVVYDGGTGGATHGYAEGLGIAVGSNNTIYVVGIGNNTPIANRTSWFVRAYTSSGQLATSLSGGNDPAGTRTFGVGPGDSAQVVTLDSSNNLYVAGIVATPDYWGPKKIAIRKYTSDLKLYDGLEATPTWGAAATPGMFVYGADTTLTYSVGDMIKDTAGNLYVTGNAGNQGMVTIKVSANGSLQTDFGNQGVVAYTVTGSTVAGTEKGVTLATDGTSVLYVGGSHTRYVSSAYVGDGFVRKYDLNGKLFDGTPGGQTPTWGDAATPGMISTFPLWNAHTPQGLSVLSNANLVVFGQSSAAVYSASGTVVSGQVFYYHTEGLAAVAIRVIPTKPSVSTTLPFYDFAYAGQATNIVPGSPSTVPASPNWMILRYDQAGGTDPKLSYYDSNVTH